MSFDYVRQYYGVPAKRGARVRVKQRDGTAVDGTIVSATHYVFIRLDGCRRPRKYHPTDPSIDYSPPVRAGG